jgi:hypothetical protein
MGLNGFQWVRMGFYYFSMGFNGLLWFSMGFQGFYWFLNPLVIARRSRGYTWGFWALISTFLNRFYKFYET